MRRRPSEPRSEDRDAVAHDPDVVRPAGIVATTVAGPWVRTARHGTRSGCGGTGRSHPRPYAGPVPPARPRTLAFAVAAVVAIALAGAVAQEPTPGTVVEPPIDATLPFSVVRVPGEVPVLELGANRFTPSQLARFLAGVDGFLARAAAGTNGGQLTWQVDGTRGYLSLSTSPFDDGPAFLLTLRGEPVRTFLDAPALLEALTRLGARVLSASPSLAEPEAGPSAGADAMEFAP